VFNRRDFGIGAVASGLVGVLGHAQAHLTRSGAVKIEGPILGGQRGHVFGGFLGDLGQFGYVEEEYFVSGTAQRFAPVGQVRKDGRWSIRPVARAPFRTRVIVHRPIDPKSFNGIVICEWANVTAGFELSIAAMEGYHRQGFAYAAISAQMVGIEGFPGSAVALRPWDPDRYGTLSIPGDSFSFDIFSTVAKALGPNRPLGGVDPMNGLRVRKLIATGASQSAARLTSYANAVQPLTNLFSGFIPVVGSAYGTHFDDFVYDATKSESENRSRRLTRIYPTRIRSDLDVPVIYVSSQSETLKLYGRRQPDTNRFRLWEVAGASHLSSYGAYNSPDLSARDGIPPLGTSQLIDLLPVVEAACAAMVKWIDRGKPPQKHDPIRVRPDGTAIESDDFGNARGGVRLPELVVPTARYDTIQSPQRGTRTPFSPEQLDALYPTTDSYVEKVRIAAANAVGAGVILQRRADQYLVAARRGFQVRA